MERQQAGHELLEHTADIGVRAYGATLEALFEQATIGLAEVLGAWRPGPGTAEALAVEAGDLGGLLVDWLNEVVYLQEMRGTSLAGVEVEVERAGDGRVAGSVVFGSQPPSGGIYVKAVTYHQLKVERQAGGWVAEVYLDV